MTKAEALFQRRVREIGCILCHLAGYPETPCEVHHMLSGGRRRGEMFVLGLCHLHHQGGDPKIISRDHNQRRFESAYGSEESLLAKTRELVREREALTV